MPRYLCIKSRRIADGAFDAGESYDLPASIGDKYTRLGYFEKTTPKTAPKPALKKEPARKPSVAVKK